MQSDRIVKFLLLIIAVSLAAIALHTYVALPVVQAQSGDVRPPFYIEPGVAMLRAHDGGRQVLGKVVIDLRNGNIWGFPTLTQDPYPAAGTNTTPPTSHPFLDVDK
jgi:hypothetical protein